MPLLFTDEAIRAAIESAGQALGKDGKLLRCRTISAQLDAATHRASLPFPSEVRRTESEVYRERIASVLVVASVRECSNCPRWHVGMTASAFILSADGMCATNYHVLAGKDPEQFLVVASAWGEVFPVTRVLAASRKDDSAVFQIDPGTATLAPAPLRTGIAAGEPVALISHPVEHFFTLTTGVVSRRIWRYSGMTGDLDEFKHPAGVHDDHEHAPDPALLAETLDITADYGVGSSGAPVLDLCGNVVAMVSNTQPVFAQRDERKGLQMNFHHCVPAETILRLILPPGEDTPRPTDPEAGAPSTEASKND